MPGKGDGGDAISPWRRCPALVLDARGASPDPKGGVYYVSSDFGTNTPAPPRLAMSNGIALSLDGKELRAVEVSRNLLHRVKLADATRTTPFGTATAYH